MSSQKLELIFTCHTQWDIPEGVNLRDKSVVSKWWVDSDLTLHIQYVDDKIEMIECEFEPELHSYTDTRLKYNIVEDDINIVETIDEETKSLETE